MNTKNRSSRVLLAAVVMAMFVFTTSSATAELTGQLGILGGGGDLTGQINPATGVAWQKGDAYRLIFATSTGRDATSTDINDYNTFVQNAANSGIAGLSGATWRAMASTLAVPANVNTSTNSGTGESFWLVDGTTLVADNYADLYGSNTHSSVINQSETGGTPFDGGDFTSVWTGSNGSGGIQANDELGDPDGTSLTGLWNFTSGAHWIQRFSIDNTDIKGLYGVSEVLTVQGPPPMPEPTSLVLAVLGFVGLAGTRRRRVRK